MIEYNLQFFAKDGPGGEKTEEPTSKKLSDARKEGQVAKSKEINNGLTLLGLFLILKFTVGRLGTGFLEVFNRMYNLIPELVGNKSSGTDIQGFHQLFVEGLITILNLVAPIFAVGVVIAIVGDFVQVKWRPTTKPLQPKFSKMNPISGFKKIISARSLFELVKSVFKIGLILYVALTTLEDKQEIILRLYDIPLMLAVSYIGEIIINLGIKISAVYMIVAFVDYIYQKYKFRQDMKMTKQEVKDEYKNSEGDPAVKSQQRARMREASQRRMMQQVPQADVVITNPTHFAVAVKYDPDSGKAPVVLAKGEDFLAQRIKDNAKENNIQIVENKPLARMLYYNVDIGMEIPPELYQAVAEVLAYVYSLKNS